MADLETNVLIRIMDAFTGPLRKLDTGLEQATDQADKLKKKLAMAADLNQAAESAGRFGNAILGPLRSSVDEFVGFERRLSELQAISGEIGTDAFQRMKEQAATLGAQTSYSGEEAAAAMTELARAGRNANEIMQTTPTVLSLARASNVDLARSAEILGSAMAGMGLESSEANRAANVLTKTFTGSATSLEDLSEAFKMAAPTAKAANIPMEQVATAIGVLGNAGIRGTMAGTGLQGAILSLIAPSRTAQAALGALGFRGKALKEMQEQLARGDLGGVFRKIGEGANKLPDARKLRALEAIFGRESLKSATVLIDAKLDQGIKGWDELQAKVSTTEDKLTKMAAVMEDNLGGAMERASGAVSGLKTQLGEVLKPTVESLSGVVETSAGALTDFAKAHPDATRASLELAANLGLTALALEGLLTAQATYLAGTAMLSGAYGKLSGSLLGRGGLVLAAGAAGYAVGTWANEAFGLEEKIYKLLGGKDTGERDETKGLQAGEDRVFAGGWRQSGETGAFTTMGEGPGPLAVREARAAGAKTLDQINAYLKAHPRAGIAQPAPALHGPPTPPVSAEPAATTTTEQAAAVAGLGDPRIAKGIESMDRKVGELVDHLKRANPRVAQPLGTF